MQKSDPLSQPDIADRATSVLQKLCARDIHIATAESCTGGLVAALLTDIEGCSHAFERGFVSYTDQSKHELLGVDRALLDACGAVSRPVAIAMAEGAMARSGAQIAVSTTGFAGPGRPEVQTWNASCMISDRRSVSFTSQLCLVQGRVMPTVSAS